MFNLQVLRFSTEYADGVTLTVTLLGRVCSRKQPWFHVKELERETCLHSRERGVVGVSYYGMGGSDGIMSMVPAVLRTL